MIRNPRLVRAIALYLLLQFSTSIILPTVSLALTSGPSQPEFSSFEPIATTNMVDEFTGDFTYNLPVLEIPGPQGSGYPISLSYHSGVTPEEEASWVGYGWTLNPGAINRAARGVPDDSNGDPITFHNKMPKNWTATVNLSEQLELWGADLGGSLSAGLRYNNYRGFGYSTGAGLSLGKGLVSMGYQNSDGNSSYSLNVNPWAILSWTALSRGVVTTNDKRFVDKFKKFDLTKSADYKKALSRISQATATLGSSANLFGSTYGVVSHTETTKPNAFLHYTGNSYNVSVNVEGNVLPIPVGGTVNLMGSYSYQENVPSENVASYGYLYSSGAEANNGLMDYHVENETDFSKRDVFLGVPFNDADNFIVTAEGLGGGFRLYNKRAGHFGPRTSTSTVDIYNVGGEAGLGWTFGPGADLGKGESKLSVGNWARLSSFADPNGNSLDEPVFFRFNNDLGGEWGTNHDDKPLQADFSRGSNPLVASYNLSLPTSVFKYNVDDERSGRSSYIGFHTNGEMAAGPDNSTVQSYSKNTHINKQSGRTTGTRANLIGELAVFNETGSRYVYALPVYNKAEKSLSYSAHGINSNDIDHNFLAYTAAPNTAVKVGEEKNHDYANTFLLTEITSPDYIDRGVRSGAGEPGPSPDDLGGYTRFNYKKHTGNNDAAWFNWRTPYRGYLYNKNSHSDPKDDLISYSEGLKEIYYVSCIETKTHVAIFSTSVREDAQEAAADAGKENGAAGTEKSLKLDKIELYSIKDFQRDGSGNLTRDPDGSGSPVLKTGTPKPIKTVFFDYDYSLVSNVPNASEISPGVRRGKLTLKRVYVEYNGINRARISPYEFSYQYPGAGYNAFPSKYKPEGEYDVTVDFKDLTAEAQNPDYTPFLTDAWGNYQSNGITRFSDMRPWLDQTVTGNDGGFDPAAWNLKVIKLPSGGEIHVQYEQDDYSYVQDQEAHVMVALKTPPQGTPINRYYIDPVAMGISTTEQLTDLEKMIRKRYIDGGKKMYFKFLYSLIDSSIPNLSKCNADYITGYVTVTDCVVSGSNLYIEIKNEGENRLPREICKDFVKSQRLGMIDPNGNCNASTGMSNSSSAASIIRQLLTLGKGIFAPDNLCEAMNVGYSYFRLPTPLAKKGGGIRVKRLMMFDKRLETSAEPVLYGSEYLYQTNVEGRTISSGVAVNEPQTIREENILVDFIARKGQSTWSKTIAGRDKERSEGPLGESLLPGPSVGYSRVVVRNIYSGKTNPGFSVNEFFTARDFPVKLAHPDKAGTMTAIKAPTPDYDFHYDPFYTSIRDKTWATQGFSFVLNNMHGQPKSMSSYSGPYEDVTDLNKSTLVSRMSYEYYSPGEKIPTMASMVDGVQMKNPGREVDLTFAQRKVKETSNDTNIEADFQMTIIPLALFILVIPYPTAIPSFSSVDGELSTHATSKVVRYPAIVKKMTVLQDGIEHTEENLAFDEFTGKPVSVRSSDEFKGAYLAQSIPASWEYPEMGGKWKSEGKKISGTFGFTGDYISLGMDPCDLAQFTRGDKIQVGSSTDAIYYVTERDYLNNRLKVELATNATAVTGSITDITIIHTGRTNQLQTQAGAITMHDEQKDRLTPPIGDKANRYESQTFASELKSAVQTVTDGGSFILHGPYDNLDMSGFADKLSGCTSDLTNARVKEIKFQCLVTETQVTLQLMAFEIQCEGETYVPVRAVGVQ